MSNSKCVPTGEWARHIHIVLISKCNQITHYPPILWATVYKTVRPMLSDRCLSVLSLLSVLSVCPVCDVGVLWPNGLMDQDETWHAGRTRPWPHCVRWGPRSPSPKGGGVPQFSTHVYSGQTAGWIKMALGMEVGLGSGHIVLDGDPAPLPQKGDRGPNFRPISVVAKRLDASRCHLVRR